MDTVENFGDDTVHAFVVDEYPQVKQIVVDFSVTASMVLTGGNKGDAAGCHGVNTVIHHITECASENEKQLPLTVITGEEFI